MTMLVMKIYKGFYNKIKYNVLHIEATNKTRVVPIDSDI